MTISKNKLGLSWAKLSSNCKLELELYFTPFKICCIRLLKLGKFEMSHNPRKVVLFLLMFMLLCWWLLYFVLLLSLLLLFRHLTLTLNFGPNQVCKRMRSCCCCCCFCFIVAVAILDVVQLGLGLS